MLTVIEEESESAILMRAKSGDGEAFEQVIHKYRSQVESLVYHMYGDENLAEDAAQTAFIQAWRHLPKFDGRAPFRNWLFKIAMNSALDHLRREKPQVDIDALFELSQDEQMEARIEEKQRWCDIKQAVAELPDASRSVLVLKEIHGLRYQEIADVLDIPMGTVMSRLNYARKILAGKLSMYLEEV